MGNRALLEGLERALASLWIAYQPIVSWTGRQVVGYEALARTEGLAPTELFGMAAELGRTHDVSRAVRSLARVPEVGCLFLNVHPDDLTDEALYDPRHDAARIVLELSESDFATTGQVANLRALGYRIALDDLGAGYNGLATLATLSPDVAKIDMALVRGVERDAQKARIVRSLCEMCRDIGVQLVCEGVETAAERDTLIGLGCDLFQGYLFGRPVRLA